MSTSALDPYRFIMHLLFALALLHSFFASLALPHLAIPLVVPLTVACFPTLLSYHYVRILYSSPLVTTLVLYYL